GDPYPWTPRETAAGGPSRETPSSAAAVSGVVTPGGEAMKVSFNWLHLTDLHFGMSGQKWLWPNTQQEFFDDLEQLHKKAGPWDAVLFTGDFVQRGGSDEFKKLNEMLSRLWEHLQKLGSVPVLLGVPGNHDLARPSPGEPAVAALRTGWTDQHVQQE